MCFMKCHFQLPELYLSDCSYKLICIERYHFLRGYHTYIIKNATEEGICVGYEREKKQNNIDFPSSKLPTSTNTCMPDPLIILFEEFGIWLIKAIV